MTATDTRSAGRSTPHATQPTVLGPACHIRGELVIDGDAVILGAVDGDIEAAGSVEIGPDGSVAGRVKAAAVVVQGRVLGPVFSDGIAEITGTVEGDLAAGEVVLGAEASLLGNLRARVLTITEGGSYRGEVVIGPDALSETTPAHTANSGAEATANAPAPAVEVNTARTGVGNLLRRRHELLRNGA